jgi:hypothetical protein
MEEHLHIEEIVLNLKLIAKIKQNDKMVVINKIIQVDNRVLQPLRRWYTSDNRYDTIHFIDTVVNKALDYMDTNTTDQVYNPEALRKELLSSLGGLDHLGATYKIDNLMSSKIDILKGKIQQICGRLSDEKKSS